MLLSAKSKSKIYFAKQSEINLIVIVLFAATANDFVHWNFRLGKYCCGIETVVFTKLRPYVTLNYIWKAKLFIKWCEFQMEKPHSIVERANC